MMDDLDIERISTAVAEKIRQESFHIDAEEHYNQHRDISEILDNINSVRNSVIRWFLRAVAAGLFVIAAIGFSNMNKG